jgi:hypothetical protein
MKLCLTEWEQMSQNENNVDDLVEKVSEYVPTDVIVDLKSGIYNLFVSLLNNLMIHYGPIDAVKEATAFIDQISDTFKNTLPKTDQEQ